MKRYSFTRFLLFAVVLTLTASSLVPILPAPKAEAGSPALQSILDSITDTCKDMNKDGDRWDSCETKQQQLATVAGCSDKMFEQKDGKWSAKKSALDDCQKKINDGNNVAGRVQPVLEEVKECVNVDGIGFKACEEFQKTLQIIGCSGSMYEKAGGDWSYKTAEVQDCQKIINTLKSAPATKPGQGSTPSSGTANDQDTCDGSGSGPLGWIVCPIIDMGLGLTKFAFTNFIKPFMEDVPISTESGDPGYSAWKQFRLIGNIVLIGSMLAVVYAQARGDK